MTGETVWVGLTTFLGGSLMTGATVYFTAIRMQLTKSSHKEICDDKQKIVKAEQNTINVELKQIVKTLDDHGEKLDRILMNGRPATTTR